MPAPLGIGRSRHVVDSAQDGRRRDGSSQRHRGRIRTSTAQGGDVPFLVDALEAGHDHHVTPGQRRTERLLVDPAGDLSGRAAVLLNAAAAIYVSGLTDTYAEALERATEALESGRGAEVLESLRATGR